VEFVKEAGGQCNPCVFELEGESHLTSTFTGQQVSKCHDAIEGEIWHDGTGHVYSWVGTDHDVVGPGCTNTPCAASGEAEWNISAAGETGPTATHVTIRLCFASGGTEVHCDAEFIFSEGTVHLQDLSTSATCAFGTRRVETDWKRIVDCDHPAFEVTHL
jgi:hypothetical protein